MLHFLLVTVVPGCLLAGWWQVHRALSGNLLSYFYSLEWPIFAVLGVIAWWQLVHDQPGASDYETPREVRRSRLHRDDEVPSRALVWDEALESPELKAYNEYLRALAAGRGKKTWRNPRGLPPSAEPVDGDVIELGVTDVEPSIPGSGPGPPIEHAPAPIGPARRYGRRSGPLPGDGHNRRYGVGRTLFPRGTAPVGGRQQMAVDERGPDRRSLARFLVHRLPHCLPRPGGRARFRTVQLLGMVGSGLVPGLAFYMERKVSQRVKAQLALGPDAPAGPVANLWAALAGRRHE